MRLITGWYLSLVVLLAIGAAAGIRLSLTQGAGIFVLSVVPVAILRTVFRDAPQTVAQVLHDAERTPVVSRSAPTSPDTGMI
jgi:hypothetical protein